jgi:hypothetical protein
MFTHPYVLNCFSAEGQTVSLRIFHCATESRGQAKGGDKPDAADHEASL